MGLIENKNGNIQMEMKSMENGGRRVRLKSPISPIKFTDT